MDRQSWFLAARGFWYDFNVTSLTQQLLRSTHLRSRWASCDSGRKRTSVSSRSLSCRPFWQGSPDKFYQWWPGGSRRLGCVQLPQYGHEDQSRLSSLGGSESTAGTIKKGMKWNTHINIVPCFVVCTVRPKVRSEPSLLLANTCDLCFSLSFTSLSTSLCLLLVSSCSRFSSSSLLRRSSSRACLRISISRSCTGKSNAQIHSHSRICLNLRFFEILRQRPIVSFKGPAENFTGWRGWSQLGPWESGAISPRSSGQLSWWFLFKWLLKTCF